jgi:hypothetical protein
MREKLDNARVIKMTKKISDFDPLQQPVSGYVQDDRDDREIDHAHSQTLCNGNRPMAI